jgi:uncharacterized protein YjbJ (UPF0337 family)
MGVIMKIETKFAKKGAILSRAFGIVAILTLAGGLSGCDVDDGPVEEAGARVDETYEDAVDAVEDAADDIEDGAEDMTDSAGDAMDDMREAAEDAAEEAKDASS